MMKKLKLQKGITVISMSIAVIVLLIITGTIIYNVTENLGVQKLKAMQTDIANIREKVSTYYAQYGAIPVKHEYSNEANLNKINVISEAVDTGKFYVIELSSLDNLTLNYGKDYEKIRTGEATTDAEINELTDIYIINEDSHNIFFVQGIRFDGEMFYTDYTDEDIDTKAVSLRSMIEICTSDSMYNKTENTTVTDDYGNEITIPAGFRLVIDETTNMASHVTEGMVIQDRDENQFVWVPVGEIKKADGTTTTINLSRYEFADGTSSYTANDGTPLGVLDRGTPIDRNTKSINAYVEDTTSGNNTHAIDIKSFKDSAKENSGYYIARYEASYGEDGKANSKISTGYSTTSAPTAEGTLWNFVTQPDAATASRKMYEGSTTFTSDLANSYAWDTAIVFIQTFGEGDEAYSRQSSKNSNLANTGRNDVTADNPLNINDMASNLQEWTTETSNYTSGECTYRGGLHENSQYYTAYRFSYSEVANPDIMTFRPILYIEEGKLAKVETLTGDDMLSKKENTKAEDSYGNPITIPAGFKVVIDDTTNNAKNVTEGIVIQDSEGNQFVWVPVGDIKRADGTVETIKLSRYEFADGTSSYTANDGSNLGVLAKGTPIDREDAEILEGSDSIIEDTLEGDNTHAINIGDFKSKTNEAGGYYIARYEASYGDDGKANSKISKNYSELIAPSAEGTLWNFITQPEAATASRAMYTGEEFTSDLVNSYAWDTAIVFIQTFGGDAYKTYSRQNSKNAKLGNTGRTDATADNPLNINDMSSNAQELTTETITNESIPCVTRGGYCIDSAYYTAIRYYGNINERFYFYTFRPILYINN